VRHYTGTPPFGWDSFAHLKGGLPEATFSGGGVELGPGWPTLRVGFNNNLYVSLDR
jgi:hypothetical protein